MKWKYLSKIQVLHSTIDCDDTEVSANLPAEYSEYLRLELIKYNIIAY